MIDFIRKLIRDGKTHKAEELMIRLQSPLELNQMYFDEPVALRKPKMPPSLSPNGTFGSPSLSGDPVAPCSIH